MAEENVMADQMADANPRSKLAVILAADVVGFSVLMGQNEYQTLRNLRACRVIVDEAIRKNHGRIFTTAGDSVLAEFSSPVDAIVAAVEFQRNFWARNGVCGEADRMAFRVGLNLGDVIVEGGVPVRRRVEGGVAGGEHVRAGRGDGLGEVLRGGEAKAGPELRGTGRAASEEHHRKCGDLPGEP